MSEHSELIAWFVIIILPIALVVAIYTMFVPFVYDGRYPSVKTWKRWLRIDKTVIDTSNCNHTNIKWSEMKRTVNTKITKHGECDDCNQKVMAIWNYDGIWTRDENDENREKIQ
jgi:hypothetical protein